MKRIILLIIIMFTLLGCEDLLDVGNPRTQLTTKTVFENDYTATAAISGLYQRMSGETGRGVTFYAALSADEIQINNFEEHLQFYNNSLLATNTTVLNYWNQLYNLIFTANSIIEGLENSEGVTPQLKAQLLGEAKFARAFYHFYLVNLFGDVPYIATTNYEENSVVERMPVDLVYEQIIRDLVQAKEGLAPDYSYSGGQRARINRFAATALLARLYLYKGDWVNAEEQASLVIASPLFELKPDLNTVFLKNSTEAIFQLIPVGAQTYTNEGVTFYKPDFTSNLVYLTFEFINSFEPNDQRVVTWIAHATSFDLEWDYPVKYKQGQQNGTGAEYSMVLRLAEQYLIRAEARANQPGKLIGANSALSDLNKIRNRAGLDGLAERLGKAEGALTEAEVLDAIEQERKVELFTEWGDRWLTLKRRKRADVVLQPLKPDWQNTDVLYPIPQAERLLNRNLSQNDGY